MAQQREIRESARLASMAAHPAGKARDNQVGAELLLANADAVVTLPPFEEAVFELAYELADTLISKQADYGPRAISDSPGGALNGINVRMHDKLSRAVNLVDLAVPYHESIRDTYLDLAGYSLIALLVLDGTWPQ